MKLFDLQHESMPREPLQQLQLERLQALLARLKRTERRYRDLLGDAQVAALDDIGSLPLTQPDDLVEAFPYGMFALPLREVVRLHSSTGPSDRQIVIGYTRNDLVNWGRLVARQFAAAGMTAHDVIQLCFEGGLVKGAAGYTLGAELIEASIIPEDPFHIEYQLAMLQNYRVTVLITTPTNARELVELLRTRRIDPQSLPLRTVLLTRLVPPAERAELHTGLSADVHCSFGVAEVFDPGLCVECREGRYHVNEDHFLVEIHDGELVVTTLCREAMPLLRYATRISASLVQDQCPCGRTGAILIPGERRDGRMRVNEMPLYTSQIAEVLTHTRAAGTPFRVEISERGIVIGLRVTEELFPDVMADLVKLQQHVEREFATRLGIHAEVRYLEPYHFTPDGAARERGAPEGTV